VILTDKLRQVARTHPISQRSGSIGSLPGVVFEYIHI
jgi:hypothetical protein